ncbi:hypothetical protein [Kangiella shandongensis]|uniref:hypothetical protein n=1 Tax=Kangiella shandongensis TaxID=2763258 RepID=UPI001CC023E9|nr:hypothetical protein [Kangiella shandongensis]
MAMVEAIHKPCINLDTDNKELYQEAYQLLEEKFGKAAHAHEKYNEAQLTTANYSPICLVKDFSESVGLWNKF